MSFSPRRYDEIVVDLLTTLTGGTVRETVLVPDAGDLPKLRYRPVRRVSHLAGSTAGREVKDEETTVKDGRTVVKDGARDAGSLVATVSTTTKDGKRQKQVVVIEGYSFTAADFELVSSSGGADLDRIRFRDGGRKPLSGSTLTINYYPVQTPPVPLTDLNVGSVTRTLLESVARELAEGYQHLDLVYRSAFLDTAEGSSLDRVVALTGVTRLPPDRPVALCTFTRRADSPGRITVPAGTAVTDAKANRYRTAADFTLEPNESSLEVQVIGERASTLPVGPGELNRLEVSIAGISTVANAQAARLLGATESDDDLRRRARGALHGAVRGTLDALRFGVLSIAGVKNVEVSDQGDGILPGELAIRVSYEVDPPTAEVLAEVQARIDEYRPAGIRVIARDAKPITVAAQVQLTLAGTGLRADELTPLQTSIAAAIKAYLGALPTGGTARKSKLQALALQDPRVHDAKVVLKPSGGAETEELALSAGQTIAVGAIEFPAAQAEQSPASTAKITATLAVHLVGTATLAEAQGALDKAVAAWLAKCGPDLPLTVDGLVGTVRDESRYAIVRGEAMIVIENGDRFAQLTDGQGSYTPGPSEGLALSKVNVTAREGTV